ncbi:MAG: DUF1428 domain-containing protein [Proteobacteria bacterium]|nr:DUF1428 domain-containing protein [Pseudomonadota bacterium]
MTYVDGFITPVPTANKETYIKVANAAAAMFKQHGALRIVECWGDDMSAGELTSFPSAVAKKDDETVCFSWIIWPSREARNAGMEKVSADPRMQPDVFPMLFDNKRMVYGGFEVVVDTG